MLGLHLGVALILFQFFAKNYNYNYLVDDGVDDGVAEVPPIDPVGADTKVSDQAPTDSTVVDVATGVPAKEAVVALGDRRVPHA